jgi:hypothetical protein
MMSDFSCEEYNAAIALNSLAIKMMEKSCYKQAFETFADALYAMRNAELNNSSRLRVQHAIGSKLKEARSRFARPKRVACSSISLSVVSATSTDMMLPPTPSSKSYNTAVERSFVLIRMDDTDLQEYRDPEQPVTILHYNLAVCHLCRAHTVQDPGMELSLREAGVALLERCRGFLSYQYKEACEDAFALPQIFLYGLVLRTLVQSLQQAREMVDELNSTLESLQEDVSKRGLHVFALGERAAAAA